MTYGVGDPCLDQNMRYHCPIFGIFNFNKPRQKPFKRHVWYYDRGDYNQLRLLAAATDWDLLSDEDVNVHAKNITDKILEISKKCVPNKIVTIKPNEPPWMDGNIKRQIRKRKRAYKKAKRTNRQHHWDRFRQIRNETITLIRKTQKESTNKLAEKLKSENRSSKGWWNCLKKIISPPRKSSIPPLQDGDFIFTDNVDKANFLNNFFQQQTVVDDLNLEPDVLPVPVCTLSNVNILPDEVHDILMSLPLGKAVGPDEVNNRILCELASELALPLCNLFNHSLRISEVPTKLTSVLSSNLAILP